MQALTQGCSLDAIVDDVERVGLADGATVWTYYQPPQNGIRNGRSAGSNPLLAPVPAGLSGYTNLVGQVNRRHLVPGSLDQRRVSTWSEIRTRTGEVGTLSDDEIHRPCGVTNHVLSYIVVDDRIIGFMGATRTGGPPFTSSEIAVFASHLPSVARAMAEVVQRDQTPRQEALMVSPQGDLLYAKEPALALLDQLVERSSVARAIAEHAAARQRAVDLDTITFDVQPVSGPMGRAFLARPQATDPVIISPLDLLTDRQREVALRVAQGGSIDTAADDLAVRPSTVRAHLKAIYATVAIGTRAELVGLAEHYTGASAD